MRIPILNGIYSDTSPDLRTKYPVNLMPVPKDSGLSAGFLRPVEGIAQVATSPGPCRAALEWDGVCYRVCGTKLVSITAGNVVSILGDVGGSATGLATIVYGVDRLAIASGGNLYYWIYDTATFIQVTDPDIGNVLDVTWVDGYFMTTDGEFLIVTELLDPTQVNPLKYGSSEVDPDPIVAIKKIRNEIYAVNRYTMEVFDNIGGNLFPFQRIDGAQVQKGSIGTHSCCVFLDTVALVGGGRDESVSVYMAVNATTEKIATEEIDRILEGYTLEQLQACELEPRVYRSHQLLYLHLPDQTLVYDHGASKVLGERVWFVLNSTTNPATPKYLARHPVWCDTRWVVGHPDLGLIGVLDEDLNTQWGDYWTWEFGTRILYGESRGAIIHSMELVALTGRIEQGTTPYFSTSYSIDGVEWSQDRRLMAGVIGNRTKRLVWHRLGMMRNWRIQRFRGDSKAFLSFVRLEAQIEPLVV